MQKGPFPSGKAPRRSLGTRLSLWCGGGAPVAPHLHEQAQQAITISTQVTSIAGARSAARLRSERGRRQHLPRAASSLIEGRCALPHLWVRHPSSPCPDRTSRGPRAPTAVPGLDGASGESGGPGWSTTDARDGRALGFLWAARTWIRVCPHEEPSQRPRFLGVSSPPRIRSW